MNKFRLYASLPANADRKTVAFVDTKALEYNYSLLCGMIPKTRAICVVKADAYGHSTELCVPALAAAGCDFFAVSCVDEAVSVREICNREGIRAEVLILGHSDPDVAPILYKNDIIQTLVSPKHARLMNEAAMREGVTLRCHAAIDTGMNRIGFCARDLDECRDTARELARLKNAAGLSLEGIFTHFAKADELDGGLPTEDTKRQLECFLEVRRLTRELGLELFAHACNSAASVSMPCAALDGVRLGILLYGVQPSGHFDVAVKPVMSLVTEIAHVHEVKVGQTVSYAGTYTAKTDSVIATLPVGYADGFLRAYSGCNVTVYTKGGAFSAPVVGRICMDQCMIDVTGLNATEGDRVCLFGNDPSQLKVLSSMADTIEYESLCLISARVPRIPR